MSKPIKTILIAVAVTIVLLGAALGVLYLRQQKTPQWTLCSKEGSSYPCSSRQTDEGLQLRIEGLLPQGAVWQPAASEQVQVNELHEEQDKGKLRLFKKKEADVSRTEFLLTGSFGVQEQVSFVLENAEKQPLYRIGLILTADVSGMPSVASCEGREIGGSLRVEGEMPYTVTSQLDGSLLLRLERAEAAEWTLRQESGLADVTVVTNEEDPDGVNYLITGRTAEDADTLLFYRADPAKYADEVSAIRLNVRVRPDGSMELTANGTETVSLAKENAEPGAAGLSAQKLLDGSTAWGLELLEGGDEMLAELAEGYALVPGHVTLPKDAQVDFYSSMPGGADGVIPVVRFRLDGGLWWLFCGGKLSREKLIAAVAPGIEEYDTVTVGEKEMLTRSDEDRRIFCWSGSQTLLLYNQAVPALLDGYTQEQLQELAADCGLTEQELQEQGAAWPCVDGDTARQAAEAVCEAVR